MIISPICHKLIHTMKNRGFDEDNTVGTIFRLKTEENYEKMLEWLKSNEKADQCDAIDHVNEILGYLPFSWDDYEDDENDEE